MQKSFITASMKYKYLIELAYDGTNYHGWQIQPNGISVQEVLEKGISTLAREKIRVVGCGRTDAGVHAQYFVAHFELFQEIPSEEQWLYKLNGFLPKDIVLFNIKRTGDDFHARFSALSRSYEYHLVCQKSPFLERYAYRPPGDLDMALMNRAARHLLTYSDFTSFCKSHTDTRTNNCDVREAVWKQKDDNHLVFHITANRFLRNMVRAIVGTLLEVGKGKISEADFCQIIEEKDRRKAGPSVPGKALFLTDVRYGAASL